MRYQRVYEAMYSMMNEKGQVIGYWMTTSKSLGEISDELKAVQRRYAYMLSTSNGPLIFYTDNCCVDRPFLEQVFPSLTGDQVGIERCVFLGSIIVTADADEVC